MNTQSIKTLADFSRLIDEMSPRDFENYIADILKSSDDFEDIQSAKIIDNREIDFLATERIKSNLSPKILWAIEVKKRKAPLSVVEIERLFGKWQALKMKYPQINVLLISASGVSSIALQQAEHFGIKIWGLQELFLHTKPGTQSKYFNASFEQHPSPISFLDTKEDTFITLLKNIAPGKAEWAKYQEACLEILEHLFCPPLESPKYELFDVERKNRRDIIFENSSPSGFWQMVRETYLGHYIVIDAKNYKDALSKQPVLAISHYLKPYGCGMFGMLLSRNGESPSASHAIKEQWIGSNKLILILYLS